MKKILALALALTLSLTALAGCSGKEDNKTPDKTPEELAQLYSDAITQNGGELVEYNPVFTQEGVDEDMNAMILESMGLVKEDMTAFAVSGSMMNVKAYGIAAVMPAEGKEEAVQEGLIDECGGIREALAWLNRAIDGKKQEIDAHDRMTKTDFSENLKRK